MRRTDLENACQRLILALPQSAEPFRTLCARPRETNRHTRMPVCRLTIVIRRDAIGFRSSAIAGQITASDEAPPETPNPKPRQAAPQPYDKSSTEQFGHSAIDDAPAELRATRVGRFFCGVGTRAAEGAQVPVAANQDIERPASRAMYLECARRDGEALVRDGIQLREPRWETLEVYYCTGSYVRLSVDRQRSP